MAGCHFKAENTKGSKLDAGPFVAEYFNFSYPFDPLTVRSVGTYTVLLHLTRTLVVLNKHVNYEGDLAESWSISPNKKRYSFIIKKGLKFSNGEEITSKDFACTIKRQKKYNKATHFDFEKIELVSHSEGKLYINLKEPMPNFIHQLIHPEFGVLHNSDCSQEFKKTSFEISSGPYLLKNGEKNKVELLKNPHYERNYGPKRLVIKGVNYAGEKDPPIPDFLVATDQTDFKKLQKLKDQGKVNFYQPHYGFTYWLSINEFNLDLKSENARIGLQSLLRKGYKFPADKERSHTWKPSQQLYLPDGGGRLKSEEVKRIWKRVENKSSYFQPRKIFLLIRENLFLEEAVRKAIELANKEAVIETYKNLKEYDYLTKKNRTKYHLIQINNDFSSADLYENIQVSINPKRPLLFLDQSHSKFEELLRKLGASEDRDKRYKYTHQIEEDLLKGGFLFPLAFYQAIFVHKSDYSLENWSKYYPEVSFWKIK